MTTFADSSAPVKLYADEQGAEAVRGLTAIAVSQLALVEVPAALRRYCPGSEDPRQSSELVRFARFASLRRAAAFVRFSGPNG